MTPARLALEDHCARHRSSGGFGAHRKGIAHPDTTRVTDAAGYTLMPN